MATPTFASTAIAAAIRPSSHTTRKHTSSLLSSSTSDTASTRRLASDSHHPVLNLNLPPLSPAISAPMHQTNSPVSQPQAYNFSPSPVSPSPSYLLPHHSRRSSTISNRTSQLSSQHRNSYTFPPVDHTTRNSPDLSSSLPSSNSVSSDLDSLFSSSSCDSATTTSSAYSSREANDPSMTSPYILHLQTDLQDIFTTLAHKERRVLEARELLVSAEKDLQQFKHQWNDVLCGNPETKQQTQELLQLQITTTPRKPVSQRASLSMSERHSVSPVTPPQLVLSLRHSIGHASELGLNMGPDDSSASGQLRPGTMLLSQVPRMQDDPGSQSLLNNFSGFFSKKFQNLIYSYRVDRTPVKPTEPVPKLHDLSLPTSTKTKPEIRRRFRGSSMSLASSFKELESLPSPVTPENMSFESSFITQYFSSMATIPIPSLQSPGDGNNMNAQVASPSIEPFSLNALYPQKYFSLSLYSSSPSMLHLPNNLQRPLSPFRYRLNESLA